MAAAAHAAQGKQYFPLAGGARDGWHKDGRATATCYCGAVQLSFVRPPYVFLSSPPFPPFLPQAPPFFLSLGGQKSCPHQTSTPNKKRKTQPVEGPGFIGTFVCNCADCHKFSATMFASNFTIADPYLTHERGRDNLTVYSQSDTIVSGKAMANYFCKTCGSLMYRIGDDYPGYNLLRIGTVDDFALMETKLRPQVEQFVEERVSWLGGVIGVRQVEGLAFTGLSALEREAKKL
jgi:hypothetical protein